MWQLTLLLPTALLASSAWFTMHYLYSFPVLFSFASAVSALNTTVDLSWHAPPSTKVSDLNSIINGTDVWGFIFNSSKTPAGLPYCKSSITLPLRLVVATLLWVFCVFGDQRIIGSLVAL
jgi:hypothetical protein